MTDTNHEIVEDTGVPPEREKEPPEEGAHPAGIRWIMTLVACLTVAATVPYLVPGLETFRAWRPGQPLPFTGLFQFTPPVRPAIASGAGVDDGTDQTDDELLAAASLPDAAPPQPRRRPRQPRPAPAADGGAGDGGAELPPAPPRVPPERLARVNREIEEFTGEEMLTFYQQLAAVGREDPGALARMMVYSVSTNGSDRVTSAMRHQLHELFGDGGKGFVPIAPGWTYQGHRDVEWDVHNWRTTVVNRGRFDLDRYGLGGVMASNMGRGSEVTFGTVAEGPSNRSVSSWRLFYMGYPGGGDAVISVDGEPRRRLQTARDEVVDLVHVEELEEGPHQVTIEVGEGHLRLYGVVMENDGPGVVVDGLMLIGASARSLHHFDEEHLATQVNQRDPDLIVFWLGGNDVISRHFTPERFREDYNTTISRVRIGQPDASCLVVSVLDKGLMENGQIRTRAYVEDVVGAQRQVAEDRGCAFFDLYRATGGAGTMRRWFHASPRLSVSDYTHLTEAGARVVGTVLTRAILKGYDDYLADGGR